MQSRDGCYSQRGGECVWGAVVLPVDPPSLGCMGSGWIFPRGPSVKTLGFRWCHEFMLHRTLSEKPQFPLERGTHFLSPRGLKYGEQSITALIWLSWHNRLQINKSEADSNCSNMGLEVKMQIATGMPQLWREGIVSSFAPCYRGLHFIIYNYSLIGTADQNQQMKWNLIAPPCYLK